jgi:hypothetical protein
MTILGAVLAYAGTSQADQQFTLRSLRGTFGFSGSGTFGGAPAAVVGLTSFDGAGGCAISARLNAGGVVTSLTSTTCSYTVNSDGTGSQNVRFAEFGPAALFTSDFVIVDAKKELPFILSDGFGGGTVASGASKRQAGGE